MAERNGKPWLAMTWEPELGVLIVRDGDREFWVPSARVERLEPDDELTEPLTDDVMVPKRRGRPPKALSGQ